MQIVAFDLDGTLVDSVGDLAAALNVALAELGFASVDVDIVRTFVGNGAAMLVRRALAHAKGDPALEPDLAAHFRAAYEKNVVGNTVPYPGVPEMLAALRALDITLAVATNKPGALARPLVHALFPGMFEVVFGPDDAGSLKPSPAILEHVAIALGGHVIAFVGDSGVDVETARNARVPSIGVAWGLRPDEARRADVVAERASDVVEAVRRLR